MILLPILLYVCILAITGRPKVKFEGGYTIETVFDGSKLGIEPHTVEVLPNGELLILDSANSNLYRISASLSLCKWIYSSLFLMFFFGLIMFFSPFAMLKFGI